MASVGAALPKLPFEIIPEAPFYIPATGPATRPRRTLKHDDTFLVLDSHGDVGASAGGADGLFHCDTRFLSHLELLLNGTQPLLLGSNVRDDNTQLTVDLTNPDVYFDHRLVLPKDTMRVVRTIFLWRDTAYQRLGIQNHGDRAVDLRLTMLFDSDFADLFEVRGLQRERRGASTRQAVRPGTTVLSYKGLDAQLRQTVLSFDPPPTEITSTTASYRLTLAPKQVTSICCTIGCGAPEPPKPVSLARGLRAVHRNRRAVSSNAATVETSNDLLNEVLCRSMSDLYMLMTSTPQGRYPYAGIPWYSTTFGRDGLITALQMLWFDPRIAQGVLRRLAAYQAKTDHPASDAQPGKILHEMREGEMAALHEVPFGLYYGSVDATPLFVMLAGMYAERTGDDAIIVELWPAIEAALAWIDGAGDPDGDGFLEYYRASDRARGGARLRLLRQAGAGTLHRTAGVGRAGAASQSRSRSAGRAIRRKLLVSGAWDLRARARRREGALPRAQLQCRADAVHRHRQARSGDRGGGRPAAAAILFRMGHSHHRQYRSALQSDVLSQRLDLAAWKCGDCPSCSAVFSAAADAGRPTIPSHARRRPARAPRRSRRPRSRSGCK